MKYFVSRLVLLAMAFTLTVTAQAKKKTTQKVYAFAIGTCLKDSTYYITPVAALDSATVDGKSHFLVDRSLYSYQLKVYLEHVYKQPYTCAVFFDTKRSKLDKRFTQLRRQYSHKSKGLNLIELPVGQFQFVNVNQPHQ